MKKKVAMVLVLIVVMLTCVGCKYEMELNWPITFHSTETEPPAPTCPCCCDHEHYYHDAQHSGAIVK